MRQIYEFLGNKLRFYREDFRLWKINSKDDVILFFFFGGGGGGGEGRFMAVCVEIW